MLTRIARCSPDRDAFRKVDLVCISKLGPKKDEMTHGPLSSGKMLGEWKENWIQKRHSKCLEILPMVDSGSMETMSSVIC